MCNDVVPQKWWKVKGFGGDAATIIVKPGIFCISLLAILYFS
jgi:hypothetical protein